MIVSAIISAVLCIFMILNVYFDFGVSLHTAYDNYTNLKVAGNSREFTTHLVAWLIWMYNLFLAVLLFRNGFQGMRFVGKLDKATFLMRKSIIMFGLAGAGIVFGMLGHNWANVLNNLNTFFLNTLFFTGAVLNPHKKIDYMYHAKHPIQTILNIWLPGRDHLIIRGSFLAVSILYLIEMLLCIIFCMCLLPIHSGIMQDIGLSWLSLINIVLTCLITRFVCGIIGVLAALKIDFSFVTISIIIT